MKRKNLKSIFIKVFLSYANPVIRLTKFVNQILAKGAALVYKDRNRDPPFAYARKIVKVNQQSENRFTTYCPKLGKRTECIGGTKC